MKVFDGERRRRFTSHCYHCRRRRTDLKIGFSRRDAEKATTTTTTTTTTTGFCTETRASPGPNSAASELGPELGFPLSLFFLRKKWRPNAPSNNHLLSLFLSFFLSSRLSFGLAWEILKWRIESRAGGGSKPALSFVSIFK